MLRTVRRWHRRLSLAYWLQCAREDLRRLGLSAPDGIWSCVPCRVAFLDDLGYVGHLHGAW